MMVLLGFTGRTGLLAGLALADNGGPEPGSKVLGEFVQLGIAVDLDGLLGGVANNVAVVAPSQVLFEFGFCGGVDDAVEVVG
jgi:hypothetical protein